MQPGLLEHMTSTCIFRVHDLTITLKSAVIVKLICCIYYHATDLSVSLLNIIIFAADFFINNSESPPEER